jgi:membrane protease subunit HflK
MTRRWVVAPITLAALVYALSGWTVVEPGEAVVVRRLGRLLPDAWGPGPHLGAPWGIDRMTRVRLDEVRRLEIGLVGVAGPDDEPGAGEYLTGDGHLVRCRGVVQYRIADPVAYIAQASGTAAVLTRLAEASLARALSRSAIDEVLRAGGFAPAVEAEAGLRLEVDRLGLGLAILGLRLTDARPPIEVQPDFDAAQAARSAAEERRTEARTRAAITLAEARATATARTERTQAQADRTVALAGARAERFLALLAEAHRDRRLTVHRLYRDALRDLLPKVKRKLVAPDEPVDLSLLGVQPEGE